MHGDDDTRAANGGTARGGWRKLTGGEPGRRFEDLYRWRRERAAGVLWRLVYDSTGALEDMVQSHLLQLTALTAMDPPVSLNERDFRNRKVGVFRAVKGFSYGDTKRQTVRDPTAKRRRDVSCGAESWFAGRETACPPATGDKDAHMEIPNCSLGGGPGGIDRGSDQARKTR